VTAARRGAAAPAAWWAAMAVFALAVVGVALVSQHRYGMEPCAWCVFSRLLFVAVAAAALVGLVWRRRAGTVVAGALVAALAAGGIAASLWQHLVASRSASCNLTLADRIVGATTLAERFPDVFEARATCADAAVSLLGVSYDVWALAAFVLLFAGGVVALTRR
jgi:disulfide bond formation protein DsbB